MLAHPLLTDMAPVGHTFVFANITQFCHTFVSFTLFTAQFGARQILRLLCERVQKHTKPEVGLNVSCWRNLVAFRTLYRPGVRNSIDAALTERVLTRQQLWIYERFITNNT